MVADHLPQPLRVDPQLAREFRRGHESVAHASNTTPDLGPGKHPIPTAFLSVANGAGGDLEHRPGSRPWHSREARPRLPRVRRAPPPGASLSRRLELLVRGLLLRRAGHTLPAQARRRAGGPDRCGLRARPRARPPALDQGLPAHLRPPLVPAVAARAPRLPPARHLRGLDDAARRAQRLLGPLPRGDCHAGRAPLAAGDGSAPSHLRRAPVARRSGVASGGPERSRCSAEPSAGRGLGCPEPDCPHRFRLGKRRGRDLNPRSA
jgi:hypothetical protein